MRYAIKWCEKKTTSTGKEKLDCTLVDVSNNEHSRVTIWSDYPGFNDLNNGGEVEGDLVPAKDAKFGPTLYPPKANLSSQGFKNPQKAGAVTAANITRDSVQQAMVNKEEGIIASSTFRDATLETNLFFQCKGEPYTPEQWGTHWQQRRKWLLENYNSRNAQEEIQADNLPW
jgi:hypothetical protein